MAAGPIEIARLARRLFQQAYPERYWNSSSQSIQDPNAPVFATDEERQSFLDMAKLHIAQAASGCTAQKTACGADDVRGDGTNPEKSSGKTTRRDDPGTVDAEGTTPSSNDGEDP